MVDNNLAQNANTKSNVNNMVSLHVWVKINISHNKWKIFTSQDYFYWCKQWKSFKKIVVKEKSLLESQHSINQRIILNIVKSQSKRHIMKGS